MDWSEFFFKLYFTFGVIALVLYVGSTFYDESGFWKTLKKYGLPTTILLSVVSLLAAIWAV